MNPKLLIFLFFQLAFFSAGGQEYVTNTRHIGLTEGLSHQHTKCFLQDQNGLMWVGTHYGLNRYDGHRFDTWTQLNDSLASSDIHFLMEDQAGWIWAITTERRHLTEKIKHISLVHSVTGEVAIFQKKFGSNLPFKPVEITHFFDAPDRALFFVSKLGFWKYLPDEGFTVLPMPEGTKPLNSLDGKTFWGKQKDALVHFNEQGEMIQRIPYSLTDEEIWLDGNGKDLWVRELGRPLIHFSVKNPKATPARKGSDNWYNKPWHFDKKRNWVWMAKKETLLAYDSLGNKVFDFRENQNKPLQAQIIRIFTDEKGLLWLGTWYGFQILEIKPTRFKKYLSVPIKDPIKLGDFPCRGILGIDNHLFVNTYEQTLKIDLETETVTEPERAKIFSRNKQPFIFIETHNGQVWNGGDYLNRIDRQSGAIVEQIKLPKRGFRMWAMYEDQQGTIWLDKGKGLLTYEDGVLNTFRAYNGFSSLEKSAVYTYHESKEGELWLGTNRGLYQIKAGQGVTDRYWIKGKGDYYLPASHIQFIHEDAEGFFWIATENEGLLKWHPKTKQIRRFTRADGLPTNTIYAIYEDEKGFLWMSSYFGLIQMDKRTFRKKVYMPENGINHPEFNRASHFRAPDGRIYFGGQNGIIAFYPKDFWKDWQEVESPLQVYQFTEGHDFGAKKVEALAHLHSGHTLNYPHDVRTLTFKIKTPNFFMSDKINYFYRVRPLDSHSLSTFSGDWVKSDGNTVNILGITPGRYELTMEARGLDDVRIGQPLEYEIYMAQPISQSWWFRGAILIAVIGSILAFFLWRAGNMKRRQRLLEQMVKERTRKILEDQQIIHEQAEQIRHLDSLLNETDEQWKQDLDEVVRQKLSNFNLNIADIADEMNISRTHFFRKIKTVTGLTPNQYLQKARLQEAKALLDAGKYTTVKAVSLSVGFKNSSYFSKLFKEKFGRSPSDYFNEN
ncbi:MAG: two-component regulator propeller domain-containing protein [Bacteroidota bacterium]